MVADARISAGLPGHPKTKKLIKRLGQAGAWNLVRLILWAATDRTDGDLAGLSIEDIELAADWQGDDGQFVAVLIETKFLDGEDGQYKIHDWDQHNPWVSGASRRSAVAKENAAKKWGYSPEESGLTNAQKRSARLAEARKKGTHTSEEWEAMKHVCGHACVECGAKDRELSKDHIKAICKDGSDAIDNIQPMCHRCNASKGANGEDKRPANWSEMLSKRLQNACKTPEQENWMLAPSPSPSPSPSPKDKAPEAPLPDWVPAEAWAGYVEMRKRNRKPMTARAQALVLKTLDGIRSRGLSMELALDNSTRNNWTDVYDPKPGQQARESLDHGNTKPQWVLDAGFANVYEARNAGCHERTAHLFQDGHRTGAPA